MEMSSRGGSWDLAVIGAGSAGFSAAITAAESGARVALIGHGTLGGTCVNTGCVPSKTMLRAAEALHGARAAARFPGLAGEARLQDWPALMAGKTELVADLRRRKYADILTAHPNIQYMEGKARFAGRSLLVGKTPLAARRIIIATGTRPARPQLPGLETLPALTSTTALELARLPRSLIIMGGGYIGCELAQMFARMGSRVTLVMRSRLLPHVEPELAEILGESLQAEGVILRTGLVYRHLRRDGAGVILAAEHDGQQQEIRAERLLLAAGRSPNTEDLGLAEAGIETDARGHVLVDAHMCTNRADVYAAGDVTGRDQFVYMAARGARLAARNALEGDHERYDNTAMPWVIFTDPQLAGVGMTQARARAAGLEPVTSTLPLAELPRALAARDTRGAIKLVADGANNRLLGGQILAPEGGDSIQTLALALKAGMTAAALAENIFPYLTTVEGLKLAAQGFEKDVARLSCCAG